jgi:hypothetical protein
MIFDDATGEYACTQFLILRELSLSCLSARSLHALTSAVNKLTLTHIMSESHFRLTAISFYTNIDIRLFTSCHHGNLP